MCYSSTSRHQKTSAPFDFTQKPKKAKAKPPKNRLYLWRPIKPGTELEEIFRVLKIKIPQFDGKECIPTYIEVFYKLIASIDVDYGNLLAWFLSKMGYNILNCQSNIALMNLSFISTGPSGISPTGSFTGLTTISISPGTGSSLHPLYAATSSSPVWVLVVYCIP